MKTNSTTTDKRIARHSQPISRNVMATATAAAAATVGCLLSASTASAGDWSVSLGVNRYPITTVATRVHEPAYKLRTRRVWVEPQYTHREVAYEIPAVVRTIEVPVQNARGFVAGYRTVTEIVEPAHTGSRTDRVLVRDGYYETVTERVLVSTTLRPVRHIRKAPAIRVGYGRYKSANVVRRSLARSHRYDRAVGRTHYRARSQPHLRGLTVSFGR
jgi:hypothetical protein